MADSKHGTGIEWTHGEGYKGETWNPVTGCSKVSPGCANCYAETMTARYAGTPGWIDKHLPWTPENAAHNVRLRPERLEQPLHWDKPRMVFVNSMSDLFHELVPFDYIDKIMGVILATASRHVFQVLTKRPERAAEYFATGKVRQRIANRCFDHNLYSHDAAMVATGKLWPLPNLWLGTSIENARWTHRADALRQVPAVVRFISAEPLLGSLIAPRDFDATSRGGIIPAGGPTWGDGNFRQPLDLTGIHWVIVGGESGGKHVRPMHPAWVRELRDACMGVGIDLSSVGYEGVDCLPVADRPAFFFKQWGSWGPVIAGTVLHASAELLHVVARRDGSFAPARSTIGGEDDVMHYVGPPPKAGGKLLDGREWCEMPVTPNAQAVLV